jgi:hypothetical protein
VTAFTFSVEQLRAAPPEVRRWFASEIARALGAVEAARPEPRHADQTLAACTPGDALRIFELIAADAIATRLFFELAREHATAGDLPGLHTLRMTDLLHHAGLPGQDSLFAGLHLIDRAYQQLRGEQAGNLFGFDDSGHLYLHAMTQASIHRVWQELVQARAAAGQAAARPDGFVPPRVGPSENIAAHAARASTGVDHSF